LFFLENPRGGVRAEIFDPQRIALDGNFHVSARSTVVFEKEVYRRCDVLRLLAIAEICSIELGFGAKDAEGGPQPQLFKLVICRPPRACSWLDHE